MFARYVVMQLLTWGTVFGAVGSALWLATLDDAPPALRVEWAVPTSWPSTQAQAQAGRPQRLPGPLADAASAAAGRR
jgi:hypothetical protein